MPSPLQMQLLGLTSNTVSSLASPEDLLPPDSAEWRLMKDYDLLYCFRRDSNKVQNYLKILKCRIVPEHGCWSPDNSGSCIQLLELSAQWNGNASVTDHTDKCVVQLCFLSAGMLTDIMTEVLLEPKDCAHPSCMILYSVDKPVLSMDRREWV